MFDDERDPTRPRPTWGAAGDDAELVRWALRGRDGTPAGGFLTFPSPSFTVKRRRAGARAYPTRERFVAAYEDVYAALEQRLRPRGRRPTYDSVAAALCIGRSTFAQYLSDYEVAWPPKPRPKSGP